MHDKIVIVDKKSVMLDTQNMGAQYYPELADEPQALKFTGRNMRLDGDNAQVADAYFDRRWKSKDVRHPSFRLSLNPVDRAEQKVLFANAARKLRTPVGTELPLRFNVDSSRIQFLHTETDADGSKGLVEEVVAMIRRAKKSVVIETPYLLLPKEISDVLISRSTSLSSPIEVTIFTNSEASNNHPSGQELYRHEAEMLSSYGIKVNTWGGEGTAHGKGLFIDDTEAALMTLNFNMRSPLHDSEVGFFIRDSEVAKNMKKGIKFEKYRPFEFVAPSCKKVVLRKLMNFIGLRSQY